jgi:hypothetical protein
MIVLTTSTDAQTITFIPRKYLLAGKLVLTRKDERDVIILSAEFNRVDNYIDATAIFNLTEGSRYSLRVVSSSSDFFARVEADYGIIEAEDCVDDFLDNSIGSEEVLYRDIILCTDQTEYDRYNIQKGEYIEAETTDNEYVVVND